MKRRPRRPKKKPLGLPELLAIALGGMIGGGIFTILGISVGMVGVFSPLAIALGGLIAGLASYSYVKLALHYRDEGAAYSFIRRSHPSRPFMASLIGWWVVFGYISTTALYAYTFASYALSSTPWADDDWLRKLVALAVIAIFTAINLWSVKGMGEIEDIMVYTKLLILALISAVLLANGSATLPVLLSQSPPFSMVAILIVASVTFVAYEGFELVIGAMNEMDDPDRNVPRSIFGAIAIATAVYVIIAVAAILAIPFDDIIRDKEYALAAGSATTLGDFGATVVVLGALLATMSAISGTLFGASHQIAVIAGHGFMPRRLGLRRGDIPANAILLMAGASGALVLAGNLRVILEFGSVTFLLVSLLLAVTNHGIRMRTRSNGSITLLGIVALVGGTGFILYYEATHAPEQLGFIVAIYLLLTLGAWLFSRNPQDGAEIEPETGPG